MNQYNSIFRALYSLSYQIAFAVAGAFVVVACSNFDDSFGEGLTPSSQDMEVRTWDSKESLDPSRLFSTALHKSDSIRSSNIGIAVMGAEENYGFGERRAGFFSQFISLYELNEDDDDDWTSEYPFGYEPIFDSLMMLLALLEYSGDTTATQTFNVYEAQDVDFLLSSRDSIYYDDFNISNLNLTDKPLFTFTFPDQAREVYVETPYVRLFPNPENEDAAYEFVDRLLLKSTEADNNINIYNASYRTLFLEEFKGIYIEPAYEITNSPTEATYEDVVGAGALYSFYTDGSGLELYGRSRYQEDPSIIKDTILMVYPFRSTSSYDLDDDYYGVTINTIERNGSPVIDVVDDVNEDVDNITLMVEGMGGIVGKITIEEALFEEIYDAVSNSDDGVGGSYNSIFVNQARLNMYLTKDAGGNYDSSLINVFKVTPWMDIMPYRLGLYSVYSDYYLTASDYDDDISRLTGVEDYYYEYELYYSTVLPFNGYMNRTMAAYDMIISSQVQEAWNSYLDAVEAANGDPDLVNWDDVEYRTFYVAPLADNLYTLQQAMLQGEWDDDTDNNAPIRLRLTYTLIKK